MAQSNWKAKRPRPTWAEKTWSTQILTQSHQTGADENTLLLIQSASLITPDLRIRTNTHTPLIIAAKWAVHIGWAGAGAYILFAAPECRLHNLPVYVNCWRSQAPTPATLPPPFHKIPTSCSIQLRIMHMLMASPHKLEQTHDCGQKNKHTWESSMCFIYLM